MQTEEELVMRVVTMVDDDNHHAMTTTMITMMIIDKPTGKYSSICPGWPEQAAYFKWQV
jgi:hypothetical protein